MFCSSHYLMFALYISLGQKCLKYVSHIKQLSEIKKKGSYANN